MIKKEFVINEVIKVLEAKEIELDASIEQTLGQLKNAPTAMESHSDTSRFQLDIILQNLRKRKKDLTEYKRSLKNYNGEKSDTSSAGSLILLEADKPYLYLLLPSGAGFTEIKIESEEIIVLGLDTLLGGQLLGLKTGDCVSLKLPKGEINGSIKSIL